MGKNLKKFRGRADVLKDINMTPHRIVWGFHREKGQKTEAGNASFHRVDDAIEKTSAPWRLKWLKHGGSRWKHSPSLGEFCRNVFNIWLSGSSCRSGCPGQHYLKVKHICGFTALILIEEDMFKLVHVEKESTATSSKQGVGNKKSKGKKKHNSNENAC